jgi:hypothetical protein
MYIWYIDIHTCRRGLPEIRNEVWQSCITTFIRKVRGLEEGLKSLRY